MKKIFLLILIVLLLLSCAAQAKGKKKKGVPEWFKNPKAVYPELIYLTAIGEGDTRTSAENYATANLAKIFESKVSTEDTYVQRYIELTKNDETTFEDLSSVNKSVNIKSDQILYNVQFAESYTDQMGRVNVLAYLNRMNTGDIYEEKINNNAHDIQYYVSQSENSEDIRIKYAAMSAASIISSNNEILLDQLEIISPDTKEFIKTDYDHNEISKKAAEYSGMIAFDINIDNDKDGKIGDLVKNMFTEMGFVMNQNSVLNVNGLIKFEETDLNRDDFQFVRYELSIQIVDSEGSIVSSFTEKGKEGHTTYFEAKERAVRKLGEKIKRTLKGKVTTYFDNLVSK